MNIIKRYWRWNEKFNSSGIELGESVQSLLEKKLIFPVEGKKEEYLGYNDYPWRINHRNDKITSIYFRESFFPFVIANIWYMDLSSFEKEMNNILEPLTDRTDGDVLYVVFRESFVAIAALIRNGSTSDYR